MVGDFFEGLRKKQFESWLKKIIGRDDRFAHLLDYEHEEERTDFYECFLKKMSPWQALEEVYRKEDKIF